jgi:hypothetical protein
MDDIKEAYTIARFYDFVARMPNKPATTVASSSQNHNYASATLPGNFNVIADSPASFVRHSTVRLAERIGPSLPVKAKP